MILFNDEFLFVHNPKTAGTSLVEYLRKTLREPIHTAGVAELGTYHPHLSMSLGYAAAKMEKLPDQFSKILAVVRNPYDREVSMYFYYRDYLFKIPALARYLNDKRMEEAVQMSAKLPFGEYLCWLVDSRGTCDIWSSRHYYALQDGSVPKSLEIVRIEELDTKIPEIMAPFIRSGTESVQLNHINATEHAPYMSYYDSKTEEIVFSSYRWMFDKGYCSRPATLKK